MIENGFYKLDPIYIQIIWNLGGKYKDVKERQIFCCIENKSINGLFWAIPTSDYSHRSEMQKTKILEYCSLDERDIRNSYYFIGHTNRKAIYRISNCFPIIDKFICASYISQGSQLFLK